MVDTTSDEEPVILACFAHPSGYIYCREVGGDDRMSRSRRLSGEQRSADVGEIISLAERCTKPAAKAQLGSANEEREIRVLREAAERISRLARRAVGLLLGRDCKER